ncbi:hypothetical protein [Saccharopolyspora sp. NPDC002686]|uniref:hypothetical protein n=1 Tax=Saccharopolyspora sp. NPDC002686 TaxID=3154541 RepID=UPI00331694C5
MVCLEGEIALPALFNRFPQLRVVAEPAELTFRRSVHVHAPRTLPVVLGPRAGGWPQLDGAVWCANRGDVGASAPLR